MGRSVRARRADALTPWVALSSALAVLASLLIAGWAVTDREVAVIAATSLGVLAVGLGLWRDALRLRLRRSRRPALAVVIESALLIPLIVWFGQGELWFLALGIRQALVLVRTLARTTRYQRYMDALRGNPAKTVVASYVAMIALGTVPLTFPAATTDGEGASLVDAVFTSTSATCITGLITMNTVDDRFADPDKRSFTPFGQIVILVLIQMGALGIMTLAAAAAILLGKRLAMGSAEAMGSLVDPTSGEALRVAIRRIVAMTVGLEALGAAILTARFLRDHGDLGLAAWQGIFTSISAFCHAGFSIFGDSLASYTSDATVNLTVGGLVILGSLGFPVVVALLTPRTWRRGPQAAWRHFSLHVRLVLLMSLLLVVLGMILWFFFEYDRSLDGLEVGDKLLASFFQTVNTRSGGFNTVDIGAISRVTVLIACIWMFIGGSPGGTGGGVKTTTVAVLLASVRSSVLRRPYVELGRRTIAPEIVNRAVSIVVIGAAVFALGFGLLLVTQPDLPFDALLFDATSAAATVGLSMGATGELDAVGKLVLVVLMFVGRLGPLTIALAVGPRASVGQHRYPEGKVAVG